MEVRRTSRSRSGTGPRNTKGFVPCPKCKKEDGTSSETAPYKTMGTSAEGTVVRYQKCTRCEHRFKTEEAAQGELDELREAKRQLDHIREVAGELFRLLLGIVPAKGTQPTVEEAGREIARAAFEKASKRSLKRTETYAETKGRSTERPQDRDDRTRQARRRP